MRARQEKVVFVASEDKALLDSEVRPYLGASPLLRTLFPLPRDTWHVPPHGIQCAVFFFLFATLSVLKSGVSLYFFLLPPLPQSETKGAKVTQSMRSKNLLAAGGSDGLRCMEK